INIGCVQENVVRDKEFACSNYGSAGCRVHSRVSEVWLTHRTTTYLVPYSFKLSAPDIFQILSLGQVLPRSIQITWDLVPLPDLLANVSRHGDPVFNGYALDRDERHHIRRSHSWMGPLMLGKVDQLGSLADATNSSFLDWFTFSDKGD